MAGLFGLSIDPETYKGNFGDELFLGMFYHQHLGKRGGFVYFEKDKARKQAFKGAVGPDFVGSFGKIDSRAGIACYSGADEPFYFESILGNIAICFSGNIINIDELRLEIKKDGGIFERKSDIEVIAEFIVRCGRKNGKTQRQKIINGIKAFNKKAEGAYSLLILSKERIYAVYGPRGHWPLIIGKKNGAIAIASESGGFANLGFKIFKELKPGEIVSIKNARIRRVDILPKRHARICDFLWAYTGFPTSMFRGISASVVRRRLGAYLARRDIENGFFPHLVIAIPDSGRFHGFGYSHEFCRQMKLGKFDPQKLPILDEILVKYTSVRSFLENKKSRDTVAYFKITSTDDYSDYFIELLRNSGLLDVLRQIEEKESRIILVILEDSLVRGTQLKSNLGPKTRRVFAPLRVEIHVRSSYPSIESHCIYGKTTQRGEILAVNTPDKEERIKVLKIDGLEYNTREDFVRAIGLPRDQICMDCTFSAK